MTARRSAFPLLTVLLAGGLALAPTPLPAQVQSPVQLQYDAQADQRFQNSAIHRAMELRPELGLSDQHSFKAVSSLQDSLGQTHVRMDQYFNGVKVLHGDAILHSYDEDFSGTRTVDFTETFHRTININTVPSLTSQEALAIASHAMAVKGLFSADPRIELVILPLTESVVKVDKRHLAEEELNASDLDNVTSGHQLIYEVTLWTENRLDGIQQVTYRIDAQTGDILGKFDTLDTQAAKVSGNSQYNGQVSLDVTKVADGFELRDPSRGEGGNTTNDLANEVETSKATGMVYKANTESWGDGKNYIGPGGKNSSSVNGQTAAVDAHYGLMVTWDFYKYVLGRNGIDNKGKAAYSRVHTGWKWDNAAWGMNGCFCMSYGDGTGIGSNVNGFNVLTCIDVAGHEVTHGVNRNSANLDNKKPESGSLNEANSDIMGSMVEFYAKGGGFAAAAKTIPATGGNWTIAEQIGKTPLRWMNKPSKDGKCPDEWSTKLKAKGIHFGCGPGNRMFFFLSQGATTDAENGAPKYLPNGMKGIGNDKAARIWYRAVTTYFKSDTDYAQAREHCIKSAVDLHGKGSTEEIAVTNAFAGVNIGKSYEQMMWEASEKKKINDDQEDNQAFEPGRVIAEPDAGRMRTAHQFLCNDECAGRLTGSAGERAAGNYIAKFFKEGGLEPIKSGGTPTPYHMAWNYNGLTTLPFDEKTPLANAWWSREEVFSAGQAFNVGCIIPGSELKNEYIVVVGHYDHLGKGYPGADDNASGTVGVMEVARCLKDSKPKRSIVCVAVSGEEKGLLGSSAFVSNCPVSVAGIKGCINLDMISRGNSGVIHILPAKVEGQVSTIVRDVRDIAKTHGINMSGGMDRYWSQSDHMSFVRKQIPSVFFNTGIHGDLHKSSDTLSKCDNNKMATVVKIARDVVLKAANDNKVPAQLPKSEWSKWKWASYCETTFNQWPKNLFGGPAED